MKDLTGKEFGKLKVIKRVGKLFLTYKKSSILYECLCHCNNIVYRTTSQLTRTKGGRKSCGCMVGFKHGLRYRKEYTLWLNIKSRCYNKNNSHYNYYGLKGIKMCDRWLNSFKYFLEDIGDRPSSSHSIDRIDVNGNYEPGNVRWATSKQQSRNTTRNVFIYLNDEKLCVQDFIDRLGIPRPFFSNHLNKCKRKAPEIVEIWLRKNDPLSV